MSSPTTPRKKPDLKDHQSSPGNNFPPSSENHSSFPNTTLEAPDDSYDPIQQPENPGSTNQKRHQIDVEALIVISVGFPVDLLNKEEIEGDVVSMIGGTKQANYIMVRPYYYSLGILCLCLVNLCACARVDLG
ncbi:hypothetical protein SADUNF_Sadunf05G0188800 [Salix dunnii]|uniref:Uncharacterized protein n=1 Tax=Salix dunnii TaxID=1413687 RepID=A0A835K713_9ROSI|nr:hypothetical protein SADUNF_Sadunf05G0188800 [Salix dunnii]